MNNEALVGWIGQAAANAEVVLSVCTGALLLGKAGLLDGLNALDPVNRPQTRDTK